MVVSEIAAAALIAVCGLKNSYRIILRAERGIRRRIRRPSPIVTGYDAFPRSFIRHIFRAGHVIAMRWEGRAKNAAQLAADARLRARKTYNHASTRITEARESAKHVQKRASDQAQVLRERAADVRKRVQNVRTRAYGEAEAMRQRASEMRDSAGKARDRVVQLKDRVKQQISQKSDTRKFSNATRTLAPGREPKFVLVRTRFD